MAVNEDSAFGVGNGLFPRNLVAIEPYINRVRLAWPLVLMPDPALREKRFWGPPARGVPPITLSWAWLPILRPLPPLGSAVMPMVVPPTTLGSTVTPRASPTSLMPLRRLPENTFVLTRLSPPVAVM